MQEIWQEYWDNGSLEVKKKIIEHYVPIVKFIAGRMRINLPPSVELCDLVSYGTFGLIDAVDKYNPKFNVKFETYAKKRIKGSIYDFIRKLDWAPRTVRRNTRALEEVYGKLESRLGRQATEEEIAKELGIDKAALDKRLLEFRQALVLSLDEFAYDSDSATDKLRFMRDKANPDPAIQLSEKETSNIVVQALDELPPDQRLVMALYYYNELTLKEIANIMELSESRISQLHTKSILFLRSRLMNCKIDLSERDGDED